MTYAPAKFDVAICPTVSEEVHYKKYLICQGQGHMKLCPLYHVTYVPTKFEVVTANG